MKDIEREQSLIRQYLLGELDEQEREQLEQRVVTNPAYKEEVLITEEELLEDFVNGSLSTRELELVRERYSASPSLWRKVENARTLHHYVSERSPVHQRTVPQRSWAKSLLEFFVARSRFRQLSLAILLLVMAGGALLVYWWRSHESRANYEALVQLNRPESEILQPAKTVVAISLAPLLLRGNEATNTVTITRQTKTVQLRLVDTSGGTGGVFRARLKDGAGAEVFVLDDVRVRQAGQFPIIVLQIPVEMLKLQDYQLEISRRTDGSYESPMTYSFSVQESR